jgi:hypothetical protein
MKHFVAKGSIVREIWGKSDTILFIFAGGAAEFALNKAVDWLYYTGRLPADPLGRLFSTVNYARLIVFAELSAAHRAIDTMNRIHADVENKRGAKIPDWAYRDVLFMLIDYSIRSYELLERKLTKEEKRDVFEVFDRVGRRMNLQGLPSTYEEWKAQRQSHMENNLACSDYTLDLFRQYRKHLGSLRYFLLRHTQSMLVPEQVKKLLHLAEFSWAAPLLTVYKWIKPIGLGQFFKNLLLPADYKKQVRELDRAFQITD